MAAGQWLPRYLTLSGNTVSTQLPLGNGCPDSSLPKHGVRFSTPLSVSFRVGRVFLSQLGAFMLCRWVARYDARRLLG